MKPEEMIREYAVEKGIDPADLEYTSWSFGLDGETADELAKLTAAGTKTATASALWAYDMEGADRLDGTEKMPAVGDLSVIVDSRGEAVCLVRTTSLVIASFNRVTAEHACAEGEGDRSLLYWKQVHRDFFASELKEFGMDFSENMPVVCETFELLKK